MEKSGIVVCVTGGSGYIGSSLVKKLLERGYTVHATLRDLDDQSKVGLLKSLPNADTNLVLFQADIYNPVEFEEAIKGCEFVFHVAHPVPYKPNSTEHQSTVESSIHGMRSIADSCVRSNTVKRLIYTGSVTASSALNEDGIGYKACIDESCWTPLDHSLTYADNFKLEYVKAKTLAEKAALEYNEDGVNKLQVVSLVCGLVGGETLLSYLPGSIEVILSPITGNSLMYDGGRLLQELLTSIPLVHIDDVCEAHIFCIEKPSIEGRFLCAAGNPTIGELVNYLKEYHPALKIDETSDGEEKRGIVCDSSKLIEAGFNYKYDTRKILCESVECGKRLRAFSL